MASARAVGTASARALARGLTQNGRGSHQWLRPLVFENPAARRQFHHILSSTSRRVTPAAASKLQGNVLFTNMPLVSSGQDAPVQGSPGERSKCWQNFHEESEAGINKQINLELYASYCYMSMATYFNRDDVALPGFAEFFEKSSMEEREHSKKLVDYQNMRGGRVVLLPVEKPPRDTWGSGLDALQCALELEKRVNQALLDLHVIAEKHGDSQMCDFIETEFLLEQVDAIKKLSDLITQAKRAGPGLGEWHFDKDIKDKEAA